MRLGWEQLQCRLWRTLGSWRSTCICCRSQRCGCHRSLSLKAFHCVQKLLDHLLKTSFTRKFVENLPKMSFFHLLVGVAIWDCCLGSVMEPNGVRLGLGTKKDSLPVTSLLCDTKLSSSDYYFSRVVSWDSTLNKGSWFLVSLALFLLILMYPKITQRAKSC